MTEAECPAPLNQGATAVDPTADVLILGEMGSGISTISAALAQAICGEAPADWIGRGTGSDAAGLALKADVLAGGAVRHAGLDPLRVLAALGGRDQAAISASVLATRTARIPVLLDGYTCTAAVEPPDGAKPGLPDHCLIAHKSAEPGHARLCAAMARQPLLSLGMALGKGAGAALACHDGMVTLAETGIG